MNRAKVQNLLPVAESSSAVVTVTETNTFTRNINHSIYRNSCRLLYAMSVTLTATETMPDTPDSS